MSLWAAVFDGVAGKAEFTGITFSNNTDIEMKVKFTSLQTGGLLSDGLAGRYFRYGAGSFRFRSSSTTYPTWAYTPVVDQFYDIMVECRSGGVELFIDGASQGIKSGAFGTFNIDTIALFNGNLFADVVIERLKITDHTTPVNSIDLFNDVTAGSSVDWPDQSANNKTITLVDTATDGSQWELIGGGGGSITITGQTKNYQLSAISASIDLTGSIDVLGNTPNYNYLALTGQIDLTGQISITGNTANYPYAAIAGNIDLTGVISVVGVTASYNYQSINGVTDLTGEITVSGQTSNYSYSAINGSIELGALISVIGNTPDYNYQSIDAVVTLAGEIQVSGSTPNYSYQAISGIVGTGEVQVIGKVTANFKADLYSSGFKPSEITVTFKQ